MLGLLLAVFAVFGVIVFLSINIFEPPNRQLFIGYLSVFSLVSMFASPLFIIVSSFNKLSSLLLFKYVLSVLLTYYLKLSFIAEFGDKNKERRIHAILSLACDLFDEYFLLCIRNVQAGSIYFCKCLYSTIPYCILCFEVLESDVKGDNKRVKCTSMSNFQFRL